MTERPNHDHLLRADGRPEGYDIPQGLWIQCHSCLAEGREERYPWGKVVMMPGHLFEDGGERLMCVETHVPHDIVIYNPKTNECRDKSGENVWTE
ncbi:MAG: hypothetical protein H0T76_20220 [Nannocystis sp.]|nr:hypothetical protein [Nannocystis sp.]MBA3548815.1 hypothetical protein [Nannocystis sp.]